MIQKDIDSLLPCPFCGTKELEVHYGMFLEYYGHEHNNPSIECQKCFASIGTDEYDCSCCKDLDSILVSKWNNRVN